LQDGGRVKLGEPNGPGQVLFETELELETPMKLDVTPRVVHQATHGGYQFDFYYDTYELAQHTYVYSNATGLWRSILLKVLNPILEGDEDDFCPGTDRTIER